MYVRKIVIDPELAANTEFLCVKKIMLWYGSFISFQPYIPDKFSEKRFITIFDAYWDLFIGPPLITIFLLLFFPILN